MQLIRQSAAEWLTWARRLFIPVALGFLLYSAYVAGDRLAPLIATLSARNLLLAWACWCVAQWIGPLTTLAFARILGLPLGYRELALISVLRLPAKYLPGGIWQSVARFAAYSQYKVKKTDSLTILIGEHLLALGVSAALGAALLLRTENAQSLHSLPEWILAGALAVLVVTLFGILKVRGGGMKTFAGTLMAASATTLFWIAAAASFCAYWAAAFDLHITGVIKVASCYLLSWAAGFVALFAPQGLGVFEWVAGHLLPSSQPLSVTVTVVAGFRLVTIAADFSMWILALAFVRFTQKSEI
ncbi:MAG: hypothetical protein ACRETW_02015 [Stenotrophobium sp.]